MGWASEITIRRHGEATRAWSLPWLALLWVIATASLAHAHPLSQGSLEVTVFADHVSVIAKVTSEEVAVTNSATGDNPIPGPWAASGADVFARHAGYLAKHIHVRADGRALVGQVIKVEPPAEANVNSSLACYELRYPLDTPPRLIDLSHDTLADGRFPGGTSWETLYHVTLAQSGHGVSQALLARGEQVHLLCDWAATGDGQQSSSSSAGRLGLFKTYCIHGIDHILGQPPEPGHWMRQDIGFDHLLFVTALVLSTRTLWDLFKVVTAFTIAHTITLTLAALRLVHVPEAVSEPLIALSIVFVALQNVFWPGSSRGAVRLGAAFFFGLFHGLGFAGGLLETMQEMHGAAIAIAIIGFSLGVELGHQMVVIPLFTALKLARQARSGEASRERMFFAVQRFGSAAVSLGGLFYLVVALKVNVLAGH